MYVFQFFKSPKENLDDGRRPFAKENLIFAPPIEGKMTNQHIIKFREEKLYFNNIIVMMMESI